jgi:hypothetical protein
MEIVNKELQKLNQFMIGREIRMKELKKKVAQCEEKHKV